MNGAGYRGTPIATSTAIRCWIKAWLAQANDGPWYIAYLERRLTVMRIVRDRDEAIGVACAMLDERIEVTGVGPLLDTGQQKIDRESLAEICRQRRRVDNRSAMATAASFG
jgi:hypothetical protein